MKKISSILKQYQVEHNYTYQKVADALKMSKSSIYAYIHELRNPTMKSIEKLAYSLGKTVSELIDDSFPNEKERNFIELLRKKKNLYHFLLENSEEKIKNIECQMKKNNNEF